MFPINENLGNLWVQETRTRRLGAKNAPEKKTFPPFDKKASAFCAFSPNKRRFAFVTQFHFGAVYMNETI